MHSPKPGWSGMMQDASQRSHPGHSFIIHPLIVNINARDSCFYLTLWFVCTEAKCHCIILILTFDQPWRWKGISNHCDQWTIWRWATLICVLHISCTSPLMLGLGIQELLKSVYPPNCGVQDMVSGRGVGRAARGHFLVNTALNAMIAVKAFNFSILYFNLG